MTGNLQLGRLFWERSWRVAEPNAGRLRLGVKRTNAVDIVVSSLPMALSNGLFSRSSQRTAG